MTVLRFQLRSFSLFLLATNSSRSRELLFLRSSLLRHRTNYRGIVFHKFPLRQYKKVFFERQYQTLFYTNGFLPGIIFVACVSDIRSGFEKRSETKKLSRNTKQRSFAVVLYTTKTHLSLGVFFSGLKRIQLSFSTARYSMIL